MRKSTHWTRLDETNLLYARTIARELGESHGNSFAAAFLDEFEDCLTRLAMRSLLDDLLQCDPPRER